jgi:hypothetical protein
MALLFCDGFDASVQLTDLVAKGWQGGVGTPNINPGMACSAAAGAYGGGALVIGPTPTPLGIYKPNVFTYTAGYTLMAAMMVKVIGAPSAIQGGGQTNEGGILLLGYDNNVASADSFTMLSVTSQGKLRFTPFGGSASTTTGNVNMCDGVYHWVEIQIVFSTTTTGSITVYVDGVIDLQITGIATVVSQLPQGHIGMGGCGNNANILNITTYYDDFIVWDTTGTHFNTFPIGQKRIYTGNPSAAGASTQFTPSAGANYTVAAQPYSGSATLTATTAGLLDLYQTTGLNGGNPSEIDAVVVNAYAYNPANGVRKLAGVLRSLGTTVVGPTSQITSALANYQTNFYLDSSGAAWNATTIAGMQVGVEAV